MRNKFVPLMAGSALSVFAVVAPAFAEGAAAEAQPASPSEIPGIRTSQEAVAEDAGVDREDPSTIVVTGTMIRGVAPGGSQTIAVTQEQIAATGAANASQLLASIPQTNFFGMQPSIRGATGAGTSINRPDLRNLQPSASPAPASATLLLLDGHRLPGMGIQQNGPDADSIPASAIERVEIVTDGGSAVYGTDAIGGVVNYVTRKRFDGIQVGGHYGFADDFKQVDANIVAGKDWGWGSAYIAYNYLWHDEFYGYDRAYNQALDWINTDKLGRPVEGNMQCSPGTVSAGGVNYALPGLSSAGNLGNRCDPTDYATIYPREKRHSLFARFTYDDGGPVTASITAFYNHRDNISDSGPLRPSSAITIPRLLSGGAPNPSYITLPVATQPASETISFDLSPVFGFSTKQVSEMESWGITPTIRIDAGKGWQINFLANYGRGVSTFQGPVSNGAINSAPITQAAAAGTFNFLNLNDPNNLPALRAARDWYEYGRGVNELLNTRLVVDGPLFHLPGGDVKAAIGGEYIHESYSLQYASGVTATNIGALPLQYASRRVAAAFGELSVPIIGAGNRGLFHSLTLSAAGRYDHYSDFGGTFNPKFGVDFEPVEWLKLRGGWGKSFQAPALYTLTQAGVPSILAIPLSPSSIPIFTAGAPSGLDPTGRSIYVLRGTSLPILPQKAKIYSLGVDVKPPIVPGLSLGMTYYNIKFYDRIGGAPLGSSLLWSQFPDYFRTYQQSDVEAFRQKVLSTPGVTGGGALQAADLSSIYAIVDARTTNVSTFWTKGFDFYARYRRPTSFGAVYVDFSGSLPISTKSQVSSQAPVVETLLDLDTPRLRSSLTLGAEIHGLTAQGTWLHVDSYPQIGTAANLNQTYVGAWNVFNLFFRYRISGEARWTGGLDLTLNVDNLLNTDPPFLRGNSGYQNQQGQTPGRLIKFGVAKKF